MEIAGYIAAVFIGIVLGMMGGGGSILTVPVLVYLLHLDAITATTYSLFIVGVTSLTGGTRAYIKNKLISKQSQNSAFLLSFQFLSHVILFYQPFLKNYFQLAILILPVIQC
jgi:hypothetical protein